MQRLVILIAIGIVALVSITVLRPHVAAQTTEDNQTDLSIAKRARWQYAVKFVCGQFTAEPGRIEGPVKPGNYATAVNIHNPNFRETLLIKKAVISLREPEQGQPSQFHKMTLKPDGATEVDCPEIRNILGANTPEQFIKGFFVVYSNQELDITSVYTAQSLDASNNPTGISIDVEQIPGRRQ